MAQQDRMAALRLRQAEIKRFKKAEARAERDFQRQMICTDCEHIGKPKRMTRGSLAVEIALWICFIVPGIIYSIWRLSSRYNGCEACGSARVISTTSPRAKKLLEKQ